MSSIKAYVEMLVDGEDHDDGTRQHFYQIIESETNRLQRLISNILNISRIEAGVVEIDCISLCPTQLIDEVIQVMMPHAHDKNITLRACVNEPLSCIWGDHDLIYQAVLNVVSNAIKYTPREGQVTIEVGSDTQLKHVAITIRDNGMGIHTRDLPRIFDKFYRASHSSAVAKGTGLGLNLVKHIVETVHDGDISVTSELGAGTTVTLRLPLLSI